MKNNLIKPEIQFGSLFSIDGKGKFECVGRDNDVVWYVTDEYSDAIYAEPDDCELLTGIDLIAYERQRQIDVEGYSKQNDVEYGGEYLALAAAVYALPVADRVKAPFVNAPYLWPFESKYYKPSPDDRIKELSKAGALIAAEIDRLNSLGK